MSATTVAERLAGYADDVLDLGRADDLRDLGRLTTATSGAAGACTTTPTTPSPATSASPPDGCTLLHASLDANDRPHPRTVPATAPDADTPAA